MVTKSSGRVAAVLPCPRIYSGGQLGAGRRTHTERRAQQTRSFPRRYDAMRYEHDDDDRRRRARSSVLGTYVAPDETARYVDF